jgi:hypothetical protein
LDYLFLNGSKSAPSTGLTSATLPFTLPSTSNIYEFRFFQNCNVPRVATSPPVTVQGGSAPSLTVNGSSAGITVAGGAIVTVGVQNGPGNPRDCVGLYLTSTPEGPNLYLDYLFLNGSKSAPSTGLTLATLPFTLPSTPSIYEFRFFQNCNVPRIATSPPVTVQ